MNCVFFIIVFLISNALECYFKRRGLKRRLHHNFGRNFKNREDEDIFYDMVKDVQSDIDNEDITLIKFIKQPVDHFDENNNQTFYMRFSQNTKFSEPNKTIFILVGCTRSPFNPSLHDTFITEIAAMERGTIFSTEHRYFGQSKTDADIEYLNPLQAIEDLKCLVERIKRVKGYEQSKVVLFGEDYGGALAVWARNKYPELFTAVVAGSALLLATTYLRAYVDTIIQNYNILASPYCREAIKEVFTHYQALVESKQFNELSILLNLCDTVDLSIEDNLEYFFLILGRQLDVFNQDRDDTVSDVCDDYIEKYENILSQSTKLSCKKVKKARREAYEEDYNYDEEDFCEGLDFANTIQVLNLKKFEDIKFEYYIYCSVYGLFPSSSYLPHPFTDMAPSIFVFKICSLLFGSKFSPLGIKKHADNTNMLFGGLEPNVTNVIFVYGDLDPWKYFGVTKATNGNYVEVIKNHFHNCLLYNLKGESQDLIASKNRITGHLIEILKNS